jgi:hypothetical protein
MGPNMPNTLSTLGAPTPRSVWGSFVPFPSRTNAACHVANTGSDNVARTYSNGTFFPNNQAPGAAANTVFDIRPTGCIVSRS